MVKMIQRLLARKTMLFGFVGLLLLTSLACSASSLISSIATSLPAGTTVPTRGSAGMPTRKPGVLPTSKPAAQASATPGQTGNDWPLILKDTFDNNSNNWFNGTYDGDYITETVSIVGGKYKWVTTAKDTVTDFGNPDLGPLGDFFVSAEGQQLSGSSNAEYGLMLRHTDAGDYTFGINENTGEYYFGLWYNDDYTFLIDYTASSAIHQGKPNLLAVQASGSQFLLYINEEEVGEVDDSTISNGDVAVTIYLDSAGDTAVFAFDNFEVYGP
jgi:hypothetical protein